MFTACFICSGVVQMPANLSLVMSALLGTPSQAELAKKMLYGKYMSLRVKRKVCYIEGLPTGLCRKGELGLVPRPKSYLGQRPRIAKAVKNMQSRRWRIVKVDRIGCLDYPKIGILWLCCADFPRL